MHIYIYTYMHACMHAYIYIYTYIRCECPDIASGPALLEQHFSAWPP